MPAITIFRAAATGCAAVALLWPSAAVADNGPGDATQQPGEAETSGGSDEGGGISATVSFDESKNGSGPKAGPVTPVGNWSPPACWFAPKYTPKQFKAYLEPIWEAGSTGHEWDAKQRETYEGGDPYKDFNMGKEGKGYWWDSVVNPSRVGDPASLECSKTSYFWVDEGDTPDVENAITPEILAQLAYERIRVPGTDVTMSPGGKQTVNLATWAWLDKAEFKPVSVTASLPALDLSATTTATPVALNIKPGTDAAELHPGSGDCPINEDGSIGTPYSKSREGETPPCGLTYLKANTKTGPYKFQATVTWEINWEGSNGEQGELPNGTFGTTQDITVQEIQAINR